MILKVNATRMELTRLKNELKIAVSGHKLLKDKRDEMMRQFINIKKEASDIRSHLEQSISRASKFFAFASAAVGEKEFRNYFIGTNTQTKLYKGNKNIMSVLVPTYTAEFPNKPQSSQFATSDLLAGRNILYDEKENLIKLAELEASLKILASELEKTRRHVNSLEYVTIPNYRETIHYIRMRIEENTRSNTARLIKVKDMVLQEKSVNKK
ncbi:MAG: V-type ATP synthase subunit D [Clostridia bacterium]|nr:V-type ATP synthase subunit D [Clostridia bacterium]